MLLALWDFRAFLRIEEPKIPRPCRAATSSLVPKVSTCITKLEFFAATKSSGDPNDTREIGWPQSVRLLRFPGFFRARPTSAVPLVCEPDPPKRLFHSVRQKTPKQGTILEVRRLLSKNGSLRKTVVFFARTHVSFGGSDPPSTGSPHEWEQIVTDSNLAEFKPHFAEFKLRAKISF